MRGSHVSSSLLHGDDLVDTLLVAAMSRVVLLELRHRHSRGGVRVRRGDYISGCNGSKASRIRTNYRHLENRLFLSQDKTRADKAACDKASHKPLREIRSVIICWPLVVVNT